jgi:hypothetical protein
MHIFHLLFFLHKKKDQTVSSSEQRFEGNCLDLRYRLRLFCSNKVINTYEAKCEEKLMEEDKSEIEKLKTNPIIGDDLTCANEILSLSEDLINKINGFFLPLVTEGKENNNHNFCVDIINNYILNSLICKLSRKQKENAYNYYGGVIDAIISAIDKPEKDAILRLKAVLDDVNNTRFYLYSDRKDYLKITGYWLASLIFFSAAVFLALTLPPASIALHILWDTGMFLAFQASALCLAKAVCETRRVLNPPNIEAPLVKKIIEDKDSIERITKRFN